MPILALDPGPVQTAWLIWDGTRVQGCGIEPNDQILNLLGTGAEQSPVYIEMIASYGMPVGREVFETCVWIGRFWQVCAAQARPVELVYRQAVKLHHCHSARAKDSNIRQALIDKYGAPGTKKAPGMTYGLKSDLWSAFAIATLITETSGTPPG